jgi:carbonic anhydrase
MTTNLRPLLERNRAFAATGAHAGLAIMPRQQVFLVTCLDPRVDPAAFLGVGLGDAPVIRNAGGRVTEAVIDDIAFIGYLARTMIPDGPLFEVAVVHHTGCGTGFLADAAFRSALAARTGLDEASLAAEAVVDPAATGLVTTSPAHRGQGRPGCRPGTCAGATARPERDPEDSANEREKKSWVSSMRR